MMQPTEHRHLDDLAHVHSFNRPWLWTILVQRQMRPRDIVIIINILLHDPAQMHLAKHNEIISAFAPD